MDLQEQFNTVVTALARQGHPATKGSQCLYRAPDGSKCAAGQLIPDALYNPQMEGRGINRVIEAFPVIADVLDAKLADRLQRAHDGIWNNSAEWDAPRTQQFIGALKMIAHEFGLSDYYVEREFQRSANFI